MGSHKKLKRIIFWYFTFYRLNRVKEELLGLLGIFCSTGKLGVVKLKCLNMQTLK